jgi:bla regulator protein blaR1
MPLVTGFNLKSRFDGIRTKKRLLSGVLASVGTSVIVLVLNAPPIRAQNLPDWQTAAGGKMEFDAASVKLATPGAFVMPTVPLDNGDGKPAGGHFRASFLVAHFIGFAYKLDLVQAQPMYEQLPKWATNQLYVIDANANGNPTKDQMRLMMQSLLADRFKLRVHFETKQGPVLALTLVEPGKVGPKLIPNSDGPPCPDSFDVGDPSKPAAPAKPDAEWRQCGLSAKVRGTSQGTQLGARNTTLGLIASDVYAYGALLGELDRPVVDHTGLKGTFDFMLDLPAGIVSLGPKLPTPDDPLVDAKGTPFVDALRKQLGLKLERSRGEVRTLVVDHVEQPSAN